MKLPLGDKGSLKAITFLFCVATLSVIGLILLFQLGFGECFLVAIWSIGWARYYVLSMIFIVYPLAVVEYMLCFSHVTIDEQGVKQCLGKLTIRSYSWEDIKRLEIWIYGQGRLANPYIIFSKTDKPNFFLRHNINLAYIRKHLVCLYKEGALELLQKYAHCPIYGLEKLENEEI